jgi:hypothetical protein
MQTKFPLFLSFAKQLPTPLLITLLALPALADPKPVDNLPALVAGAYALVEWHTDAGVFRPPQVEGRIVLMGGTIAAILVDRSDPDKKTTSVSFGTYVSDASHFGYGYQDTSSFVETPSGVTAQHKIPWEGMRSFSIQKTAGTVSLRAETGQEWVFTKAGFTYSENGKTLRAYRRLSVQ